MRELCIVKQSFIKHNIQPSRLLCYIFLGFFPNLFPPFYCLLVLLQSLAVNPVLVTDLSRRTHYFFHLHIFTFIMSKPKFLSHIIPHKNNSVVFKIIEYFQTPILFRLIFFCFSFREGNIPSYQPLITHKNICFLLAVPDRTMIVLLY